MKTLTEEEWRMQYRLRILEVTKDEVTADGASENVELGPHGFSLNDDPEEAADEEMSCWSDDGDD